MNRVSGSESYQAAADLPAPGRHEARLRLPRAFRRKWERASGAGSGDPISWRHCRWRGARARQVRRRCNTPPGNTPLEHALWNNGSLVDSPEKGGMNRRNFNAPALRGWTRGTEVTQIRLMADALDPGARRKRRVHQHHSGTQVRQIIGDGTPRCDG